jgi:hypothetical protein
MNKFYLMRHLPSANACQKLISSKSGKTFGPNIIISGSGITELNLKLLLPRFIGKLIALIESNLIG